MTISKRVQNELVLAKPTALADAPPLAVVEAPKRITKTFLKATRDAKSRREAIAARTKGQAWTPEEHARFLEALQVFPAGPWEAVAEYVGTKNSRQTMTHAQKYRQKHERQQRGLRVQSKSRKHKAREQAAPYSSVKKETTDETESLRVMMSEPEEEAANAEVESPRSGEDECEEQELPSIDLDMFNSSTMLDDLSVDDPALAPLKLDSASVLEHLFPDFEPHALHVWSTNSLTDKLDDLSAFPEDFSQSLGLWV
jgi:SHAQKYF class myb-like DNA-binding protein